MRRILRDESRIDLEQVRTELSAATPAQIDDWVERVSSARSLVDVLMP